MAFSSMEENFDNVHHPDHSNSFGCSGVPKRSDSFERSGSFEHSDSFGSFGSSGSSSSFGSFNTDTTQVLEEFHKSDWSAFYTLMANINLDLDDPINLLITLQFLRVSIAYRLFSTVVVIMDSIKYCSPLIYNHYGSMFASANIGKYVESPITTTNPTEYLFMVLYKINYDDEFNTDSVTATFLKLASDYPESYKKLGLHLISTLYTDICYTLGLKKIDKIDDATVKHLESSPANPACLEYFRLWRIRASSSTIDIDPHHIINTFNSYHGVDELDVNAVYLSMMDILGFIAAKPMNTLEQYDIIVRYFFVHFDREEISYLNELPGFGDGRSSVHMWRIIFLYHTSMATNSACSDYSALSACIDNLKIVAQLAQTDDAGARQIVRHIFGDWMELKRYSWIVDAYVALKDYFDKILGTEPTLFKNIAVSVCVCWRDDCYEDVVRFVDGGELKLIKERIKSRTKNGMTRKASVADLRPAKLPKTLSLP